jgi:hypothetical protein
MGGLLAWVGEIKESEDGGEVRSALSLLLLVKWAACKKVSAALGGVRRPAPSAASAEFARSAAENCNGGKGGKGGQKPVWAATSPLLPASAARSRSNLPAL